MIVRPSLNRCCESGAEFFDTFYADLAVRIPGIGAKFHGVDMQQQNRLVREGIIRLVDFAERDGVARPELERLGRLHGRDQLDIDPGLYPAWIETLLATVREFDDEYDERLDEAWRLVIDGGIAAMVACY